MIDAARELLVDGRTPTVEDAAVRAGVSRATAYRYFSNQRELLVATHPMLDMASLLPQDAPTDPRQRVAIVVGRLLALTLDTEAELRMSLRLALEAAGEDLPLRKGRRLTCFHDALRPARAVLSPADLDRLCVVLASTVGIEALVWLVDVAGLSRDEAADQLRCTARILTQASLAGT